MAGISRRAVMTLSLPPSGVPYETAPMRYPALLPWCLALVLAACGKPGPTESPVSSASETASSEAPRSGSATLGRVDACALFSNEQIEAIIGDRVTDRRPSVSTQNGVDVSQCYVSAATSANSVSVTVTQKANGSGGRDPRQIWEQLFGRDAEQKNEEGGERSRAEKIEDLGDEAFWRAAPIGSSLYALKGNGYVRVSVGGAGDAASKLEKSKKIAELVLPHL
jgi:hypothetical protein